MLWRYNGSHFESSGATLIPPRQNVIRIDIAFSGDGGIDKPNGVRVRSNAVKFDGSSPNLNSSVVPVVNLDIVGHVIVGISKTGLEDIDSSGLGRDETDRSRYGSDIIAGGASRPSRNISQ